MTRHGEDPGTGVLRRALPVLVLALVVAVYFSRALVPGTLLFTPDWMLSDLAHFYVPFRALLDRGLSHGRLPLWTHDLGTGLPVLAEGQVSALYPPALLLHAVFPLPQAINLFVVAHFVLAGLGAMLLAGGAGVSRQGRLLAGVTFALSGALVVRAKALNLLATVSWLPFLLWAVDRIVDGEGRRAVAALAAATALMALTGNPTFLYFTLLVAGAWAVCASLSCDRPSGGRTLGHLALIGLGVGLGLALAAVQLSPSLELTRESRRGGGLSFEEATYFGFHPRQLVLFLFPYWYGDPARHTWPETEAAQFAAWPDTRSLFWEVTAYVGWIPLALALAAGVASAVAARGRPASPPPRALRRGSVLAALTVGCLLIALDSATPLCRLVFHVVPGFSHFRLFTRFLLFVDLFLAVLAGIGLDLALAGLGARGRRVAFAAVLAVTLADLFHFGFDHNPVIDARRWLSRSPVSDLVAREGRDTRVHTLFARTPWLDASERARGWKGSLEPYLATRTVPAPNTNVIDRLPVLDFYAPLHPARLDLVDGIERSLLERARLVGADGSGAGGRLDLSAGAGPLGLLGLFAVEWLAAPLELAGPGLTRRAVYPGGLHLYRNRRVLPRAFVAFSGRRVDSFAEARRQLLSPGFDPREVIVEDPGSRLPWARLARGPGSTPADPLPAQASFSDPCRIDLCARTPRPGLLFVSALPYPGWRATIDGRPATLLPADGMGMALWVEAGTTRVALEYEPGSLWLGLALTVIAGVILLVMVVLPGGPPGPDAPAAAPDEPSAPAQGRAGR